MFVFTLCANRERDPAKDTEGGAWRNSMWGVTGTKKRDCAKKQWLTSGYYWEAR